MAEHEVPLTLSQRWEQSTDRPLLVLGFAFLLAYAVPIVSPEIGPGSRSLMPSAAPPGRTSTRSGRAGGGPSSRWPPWDSATSTP